MKKKFDKSVFKYGIRDGIPIGLGYFAVSFSLGIAAAGTGLTPFQGFLMSILCNASAGQYVGLAMIAANASFFETAFATIVTNARYLLMSCALGQKMSPETPLRHRMIIGFDVTDEIFGITVSRPGEINPYYTYGAMLIAMPLWALGTMFGIIAGNLLPSAIVSAFSVALYGMFIAIIIPPAKKDKIIGCLIAISFAASFAASKLPYISGFSEGTRTILLTVVISVFAAIIFPKNFEVKDTKDE